MARISPIKLAQLMGGMASDAEAEAMQQIADERGIDLESISDEEFFALIPEAIERAAKRGEVA